MFLKHSSTAVMLNVESSKLMSSFNASQILQLSNYKKKKRLRIAIICYHDMTIRESFMYPSITG